MKIALTGSSGFLGRELLKQLQSRGHETVCLNRPAINFDDVDQIRDALEGCDVLLHTIGLTNGSDDMLHHVNDVITANMMTALPDSVKRVVYVSSAAAAMRKGPYGEAKLRAEEHVKNSGKDYMLLRPTMIYGPGDTKNLAMMVDWVTQKKFVPVLGGGGFKVQPVHIEDAAGAIVTACEVEVTNKTYNICGPEQVSLRRMLDMLKDKCKSTCVFVSVPLKPVQFALSLWGAIYPKTKLPVKQVKELDKHEAFTFEETAQDLNYTPRKFEEGLDWLN